jgi:hypothetical protein
MATATVTLQPILSAFAGLKAEVETAEALVLSGVGNLNEDQIIQVREHLEKVSQKADEAVEIIDDHLDKLEAAGKENRVTVDKPYQAKVQAHLADSLHVFADKVKNLDPDETVTKIATPGAVHTLLPLVPADMSRGDAKPGPVLTHAIVGHKPAEPGDAFNPVGSVASEGGPAAAEVGGVVDEQHPTATDAVEDKNAVQKAVEPRDYAGQSAVLIDGKPSVDGKPVPIEPIVPVK